jgi:hypothetical protein
MAPLSKSELTLIVESKFNPYYADFFSVVAITSFVSFWSFTFIGGLKPLAFALCCLLLFKRE